MSILVTGATGFVGCRLLRELLARPSDEPVTVLGRGSEESLRTRTEAAVTWLDAPPLPAGALTRLRYVSGDITEPGLGLSADAHARATDALTQIWHSAALLSLDGDPVPVYRANVLGTRHLLELADHAPDAQLVHISTIAVAGRRLTGHVQEDDLYEDAGFQVPYEEAKYTAETMVHAWARGTRRPVAIMRPGILVTDRPVPPGLPSQPLDHLVRAVDAGARALSMRDKGQTLLRALKRGRGDTLRLRAAIDPGGTLNLLQADYAAQAMVRAAEFLRGTPSLRTLHVTHPQNTATATAAGALERRFPGAALVPVPELTDPTPAEALIAGQTRLLGYFAQRRTYDRAHLLEAIGDLPDPKPIDEDYLVRALQDPRAESQ
ncbi:SDR family oxidoreductase [Streptomyces iconiensis]|uniref:SDR family oxidoreductase n=1 Tax=Streptomyces iconiensis TaxID=1384038 RepID=A0ABT6ZZE7_9ACTN|nr:SDR family oxidoreductase [Streptomyces iconiensis]MDJ1134232.1 SDR family oxidoreductase [Streptomyces iconiensis]